MEVAMSQVLKFDALESQYLALCQEVQALGVEKLFIQGFERNTFCSSGAKLGCQFEVVEYLLVGQDLQGR